MASFFRCITISFATVALFSGRASSQPQSSTETVPHLIEQLRSDNFQERDQASKKLALRRDAMTALQKALLSSDTELARRAELILRDIARRDLVRRSERLKMYAN